MFAPLGFSSVQFSHSVMSDSLRLHGLQHTRFPCPSPTPGAYSNSCPLNRWCHPTISASVIPVSFRLQSFPASGSFPMSRLFASSGQSIGASASPSNEYSALISYKIDSISLVSKGLSRVFSSSTVWKHQFFRAQPSLWSNSQICMWLLEENIVLTIWTYMGILEARILEWVAMPSSKGSSQPRDHTQVSHIAGRRFNLWATSEALP